jgi:hypothetical protein
MQHTSLSAHCCYIYGQILFSRLQEQGCCGISWQLTALSAHCCDICGLIQPRVFLISAPAGLPPLWHGLAAHITEHALLLFIWPHFSSRVQEYRRCGIGWQLTSLSAALLLDIWPNPAARAPHLYAGILPQPWHSWLVRLL